MISRSTLIGALVVVELAIVIAAASALTGNMLLTPTPVGMRPPLVPDIQVQAARGPRDGVRTPLDRTFETSSAPHVVVDVRDVRVIVQAVEASSVRVLENVAVYGLVSGSPAPIVAEASPDGVRVFSHSGGFHVLIGDVTHELRLVVPPGARVEIATSDRIEAAGLRAKLTAHTTDGSVRVRDHRGDLDVASESGRIYLDDVDGKMVAASTREGRLYFHRVGADRLDAHTDYGRIYASDVRAVDGALTTRSGNVSVGFAPQSDATAIAHATDDITVADFPSTKDGDNMRTVRLGAGRGRFEVSSGDGSVSISQGANV